jgi:peroxiredoxin
MRKSLLSLAAVAGMAVMVSGFAVAGDKDSKGYGKEGKDKAKQHDHAAAAAKVGAPAPLFTLQDQDGKTVNLADYKDKIVVLEWFNEDCPVCAGHYQSGSMPTLAKELIDKGVVYLAVNSTKGKDNASNKKIAGEWNMTFPILNDASGEVGHTYGAKTTPHMYVINKGILAYAGAIDDNPRGNGTDAKTNYVRKAVEEIMAGQSVTTPETKPYGCSVKYAK